MDAVVEELRQSGLLTIDDGASIVRLDDYNMPPALILKRDGATLYATRDITAAIWRKGEYDFHKCLYVTSAGQSLHFAQYFKVLELMGKEWAKDLVHVPYGTMSMGGEKLASRTGNIILLDDLFDDAIEKAEKIIDEKNSGLKDKRKVAEAVGVGAIVFWALSGSRIKDTDFSWETALSFEGNAGPYVQYTYARASSILRKSTVDCNNFGDYEPCSEEIEVIKKLLTFPTKVLQALDEYEPSVISRYALEFCALFNSFYHNFIAPKNCVVSAPALFAFISACSIFSLVNSIFSMQAWKVPKKASPAPVVSIGVTFLVGIIPLLPL
jgi:arginyl-tRNA synthetase